MIVKRRIRRKYDLKARILSAVPIFCLIVYLILGFGFNLWHPGWLVFLLVPLMPVLLGYKKFRFSYPLFCIVTYIILGLTVDWGWHPGWIIFLTIPIVSIFTAGTKFDKKNNDEDVVEIIE